MWGVCQVPRNQNGLESSLPASEAGKRRYRFYEWSESKKCLDKEYQPDGPSTQRKKCNGVLLFETSRGGLMKSRWGSLWGYLAALCVLLFSSPDALGQAVKATLLGTVTDSSGSVVAGAKANATEMNTGGRHGTSTTGR